MMGDTGPCGPCSEVHIDLRPDEERARIPGKTLVNADDLREQLHQIRAKGYSLSQSERIVGAIAIGAPIRNADGSVSSCLSLLGPEFRIASRVDELARRLVSAAGEVERVVISPARHLS